MALVKNSVEGVASGTTITAANSGGASGDAFNVVTTGSGATTASDNTHAMHGTVSAKIAVGATSTTANLNWTTSVGTQSQIWFRTYLFATANPAAIIRMFAAITTSTLCGAVLITTTGALRWVNTAGTTILTTTNTIPLNAWCRVEGFLIGSATVGQVELKLFKVPDSIVATEILTSTANQNTNASPNDYRFGISAATTNAGPYWLDDMALSTTGYLGTSFYPAISNIQAIQRSSYW